MPNVRFNSKAYHNGVYMQPGSCAFVEDAELGPHMDVIDDDSGERPHPDAPGIVVVPGQPPAPVIIMADQPPAAPLASDTVVGAVSTSGAASGDA
jgi:hypothetical protein